MMDANDILDDEVARLQSFVENQKIPFLRRLSHSRPALITIAVLVVLFQLRNMPETLAIDSLDAAIAVERPVQAQSVRLVTIGDEDYAALFHARSPLDPAELSKILMAVAKGGARTVVVDIDTADASFESMETPAVPMVWNVSGEEQGDGSFTLDAPLGGRKLPAGPWRRWRPRRGTIEALCGGISIRMR